MPNLADRTPVSIDTEIARLVRERATARHEIARHADDVRYLAGDRGEYHRGFGTIYQPLSVNEPKVRELAAGTGHKADDARVTLARLDAYRTHDRIIGVQLGHLEAEYDRRPWARVFVVNNNNGHAHRTMDCHTTYAETAWCWRPDYSDKSDEEIVAAAGRLTCLVCFSSVREDILAERVQGEPAADLMSDKDQGRVKSAAERAEAKATRDAARAAKGITNPDGSELRDEHGFPIGNWKTAASLIVRQLGDEAAAAGGPHADYYKRDEQLVARLVAALVHKAEQMPELADKIGATPERVMAVAESKVPAYVRRTWGR